MLPLSFFSLHHYAFIMRILYLLIVTSLDFRLILLYRKQPENRFASSRRPSPSHEASNQKALRHILCVH